MSLPPDRNRRIWLGLDELASAQALPSLSPALSEGRKYGLSALIGLQAIGQLRHIYGRDLGDAMFGMAKTRLILRVSDAETADLMSREIGDQRLVRAQHSNSTSSGSGPMGMGGQSTQSTSYQQTTERAVLASEIASLPDLNGYLRLEGQVAKIRLTPKGLPEASQQAYIKKPLSQAGRVAEIVTNRRVEESNAAALGLPAAESNDPFDSIEI